MKFYHLIKKYIIFAGGSIIGAVIDYFFTLFLVASLALNPVLALGCSMLLSAFIVFIFHDSVTFKNNDKGNNWFSRALIFIGWSALIFALRAGILKILLSIDMNINLALLVTLGLASVLNFVISSTFIFVKPKS